MLRRYELTDEEWLRIEPLLPPENTGKQGRPRKMEHTGNDGRAVGDGCGLFFHEEFADGPFKEQAGCYGSCRNNQRTQSEKVKRNEECRNQCDKHTVHILLHAVTAVNVGRKGYD